MPKGREFASAFRLESSPADSRPETVSGGDVVGTEGATGTGGRWAHRSLARRKGARLADRSECVWDDFQARVPARESASTGRKPWPRSRYPTPVARLPRRVRAPAAGVKRPQSDLGADRHALVAIGIRFRPGANIEATRSAPRQWGPPREFVETVAVPASVPLADVSLDLTLPVADGSLQSHAFNYAGGVHK
jgi:hypothetical protein